MVVYKRDLRNIVTNKSMLKKDDMTTRDIMTARHVFYHAKGFIETYFTDSYGNKQGLYSLVSRRTKKKIYECFYVDNKKIGIENVYDENGNLIHCDIP